MSYPYGASWQPPLSFEPSDAVFQRLGPVRAIERRDATFLFDAGGPQVAVTFLAADVVRVRLAPQGDFRASGSAADAFEAPFSYALDPAASFAPPVLRVYDTPEAVVLETDALAVRVRRDPLRLDVLDHRGRLILADAEGAGFRATDEGLAVRCAKVLPPDAHLYGLGDKAMPLDRRGTRSHLWNHDAYGFQPGTDPLYKSIPFLLGLHSGSAACFGLFYDTSYCAHFDLGATHEDRLLFGAPGGELRYYVFVGPTPAHVLTRYTDLTGKPFLPPRWALGYHQSRWDYHDDAYVRRIAETFRLRGIPCDALHLDVAHMDGARAFTFDSNRFPDPAGLLADLAAQGFRTCLIVNPGVKVDPGYFAYDQGCARDAFLLSPDGTPFTGHLWPGDVHWPDFSRPDIRAWWGRMHRLYAELGVAGFWNDLNEPAILGGGHFPDDIRFAFADRGPNPTDHREGHNVYGLLMTMGTRDGWHALRPGERPFLLTRAAFAGTQRVAGTWTGDSLASWDHLRLSVTMCLGLSISGLPFCGPDIGGFGDAATPDLYARWMQVGAFLPYMRTHYSHLAGQDREPWGFGPEVEAVCRRSISLRYQLLPYLYTAFEASSRTGLPPVAPLVLAFPEDARCRTLEDAFLFGPALLVAPALWEGMTERPVYLPPAPGGWYDYHTHQHHDGGRTLTVETPLAHLPLYARAGHVLPHQPLMPFTDAFAPDQYVLRTYPGTGQSSLYLDDGHSYAYREAAFTRWQFDLDLQPDAFSITLQRTGAIPEALLAFEWQVPTDGLPADAQHVFADGEPVPLETDPEVFAASPVAACWEARLLRIRTRPNVRRLQITRHG